MVSTEQKDIFIGVCYHKPAPMVANQYLQPIHVGKAISNIEIPHTIGDNSGDNISHKNKAWCELTALYWMRHNVKADYIGLMHYRRILNFANPTKRGSNFSTIDAETIKKFGWTESDIQRELSGWDIVTAETYGVHPVGAGHRIMTNHEFYAHQHHIEDLDKVGDIIREFHPEIYPFYVQVATSRHLFFGNVAVMKERFFHEYCDFLFDVLERAEASSDVSHYDAYQSRIWGFIAERLTNVYVAYARAIHEAKIKSLPVAYGIHARPPISSHTCQRIAEEKALQTSQRNSPTPSEPINIVMAFDDHYAPHGATTIMSVISTAAAPQNLVFNILCSKALSPENRDELSKMIAEHGARTVFHDIEERRLSWLPLNRSYISLATYYRLLITELMPQDVDKAIYMDADVICVEAIENLYAFELGDDIAAGAADEGGVLQSRRLRLPVTQTYVNAGILLLNIAQLRKVDIKNEVIETIRQYGDIITLQDQDLLNIMFSGRIRLLPLKWNIGVRAVLENELEPSYRTDEAIAAIQDPGIIHFTDRIKPWNKKSRSPYTPLYNFFRQMTPWRYSSNKLLKRKVQFWARRKLLASERRFETSLRRPL